MPSPTLPSLIGGYPLMVGGDGQQIQLPGGQLVQINTVNDFFLSVQVVGHESYFGDTDGMCGNWTKFEFFKRDGTNQPASLQDYAEEWEVNANRGDPQLFRTSAISQCTTFRPTPSLKKSADPAPSATAELACAYITDENDKKSCIFDVTVMKDVGFATQAVYIAPLVKLEEVCQAVATGCEGKNGTCMWRCDTNEYDCLPDLSRYKDGVQNQTNGTSTGTFVEGCSCAVRKLTTSVAKPTSKPTSKATSKPTSKPAQNQTITPKITPTSKPTKKPKKKPRRCRRFLFCLFPRL